MRTLAANIAVSTDTFNVAFTDINHLLWSLANEVVTANSTQGNTTGNAALAGTFTASNVAVTGSLRGGTLATPASLNVSTNAVFLGALVNVTSNLSVTSLSTLVGNTVISGNSSVVVFSITGNSTVSEATLNGTNLKVNSNIAANGTSLFNNTFSVVSNSTFYGNSTILGLSVTTNSTATNVYVGGTSLRVNTISTFVGNVTMSGDLTVSGNLNATLGQSTGNFLPNANATHSLGNSTLTWLGHLDSPVIYTKITPLANGVLLGNTTNRFAAAFTTANSSGLVDLAANVTVGATGLVVDAGNKRVSVNAAAGGTDALNVSGTTNTTALTVTTTGAFTGNVTTSGLVIGNTVIFANTASVSNLSMNVIDSFPKATFPMAKYVIFAKDTTTIIHSLEILIAHEGTNVLLTKYAEIYNTSLGTFDVNINGANVQLEYTSSNAGTGPWNIKVSRIQNL